MKYDYDNDILSVNSANSDRRGRWCVAARRHRYRHHCRLQKVRVQYLTRVLFTDTLFLSLDIRGLQHVARFHFSNRLYAIKRDKRAATLRGSRPGVQSASLIMTSLMTS